MREDTDTSTPMPLPVAEQILSRRQRRIIKRHREKEEKFVHAFRQWEAKFSNQFANALANAEKHDNDIFAIFDRYWRYGVLKANVMAKSKMFDPDWFKTTHMDNDPNSKVNQVED